MGNESAEYLPLVASPSEDSFGHIPSKEYKPKAFYRPFTLRERLLVLIILLQALALIASALYKSHEASIQSLQDNGKLLYSPAQSALEYEVKSFTPGREHKTAYQGFGDDVDRAWGELYNHTIMKIPKNEAALLPNRTYPIKDEPGYYLAGLDVFHQLHCLNNLRRALYREHYADATDLDDEHVSHCVDSIRQSLMCSADISVNVWQWSDELSAVIGYSTQAHTCRNFGKLRDWARERRVHKWIDIRLFVEDDLPTPTLIS